MRKAAMRNQSGSPPVHVHVSEDTPVHVHVKSQRTSPRRTSEGKTDQDKLTLRSPVKVRTRVPWIPAGKASYHWEGPTHRLEIVPPIPEPEPIPEPALRLSELTSEEEEVLQGRISQYEKKIENLMSEVSSLRTEVAQRRKEQLLQQQDVSQQEALQQTENLRLHRSLEEDDLDRPDRVPEEKDVLLRKLWEAEADGAAAAQQVSALKDGVSRICCSGGNQLSSSGLAHQKELLLKKLETFQATNRSLRQLLRERRHSQQMESVGPSEQRNVLLKRLADTEARNALLVEKLQEKDRALHQLSAQLDSEKENARSSADRSRSLESTRARLQGRLRSKEAENNRLSVQIKNLERAASRQRAEMDHVTQQLNRLREEAEQEKEALKRAGRTQRQRAELSEDAAGRMELQLLQMEKQVAEALEAAEGWERRYAEEEKEKRRMEEELILLNSRMSELSERLQSVQDGGGAERAELLERLEAATAENAATKLENQNLQAAASALEEKLSWSRAELQRVGASVRQYQVLLDGYKLQVGETRAEAEQYRSQAERAEREAREARAELERKVEEVRLELQDRLAELEALPESLRRSQLQLQEARDQERRQERRSAELSNELMELRLKTETQERQMDLLRQQVQVQMEENRQLQMKAESLQRKLQDASGQNSDLLGIISKRDQTIQGNQRSLEEKSRECSLLSRRLQDALDDAHHQMSETRERAATRERSTQSKILELETQLSRTASELDRLRRSREEAERRNQSRLQDLKDRLEQSDGTNRSLQNYVQFLKASYAHVFADGALASPL